MTFQDVSKTLFIWGHFIKPKHYEDFKNYFENCLKMSRVMVIKEGERIEAFLTFFLTDDYEKIYRKPSLWSIPEDNPNGRQILIDTMICRSWKIPLRRLLQEVIERNFNVTEGFYYKAPYGPGIIIKRRRPLNVQHSNLIGCRV